MADQADNPASGIVDEYGRCSVSRKLEAALRRKAGDYMANRLLRDHRLPRQEMSGAEREQILLEFIEAMTEYLGKEDTRDILVELGRDERLPVSAVRRERARGAAQ